MEPNETTKQSTAPPHTQNSKTSKTIHHTKENKVGDNDEHDRVEKSQIPSALHLQRQRVINTTHTYTQVRFTAYRNCRYTDWFVKHRPAKRTTPPAMSATT